MASDSTSRRAREKITNLSDSKWRAGKLWNFNWLWCHLAPVAQTAKPPHAVGPLVQAAAARWCQGQVGGTPHLPLQFTIYYFACHGRCRVAPFCTLPNGHTSTTLWAELGKRWAQNDTFREKKERTKRCDDRRTINCVIILLRAFSQWEGRLLRRHSSWFTKRNLFPKGFPKKETIFHGKLSKNCSKPQIAVADYFF